MRALGNIYKIEIFNPRQNGAEPCTLAYHVMKGSKREVGLTPMMARYREVKAQYKDCIIFYRLGDFYEMFDDDAELVSKLLGLTLTGRDCGLEKRAPMCGIPHHSSAGYIKKLVDKGYRVAICEQLSEVQKGKKLVDRDVVRIVTAGTVSDEAFLDESKNNFVAAVFIDGNKASISWCDVTTGQFFSYLFRSPDEIHDIISMVNPREVITNEASAKASIPGAYSGYAYAFAPFTAYETILRYFKIINSEIFDFKKDSPIVSSAGALLEYLLLTQKMTLPNIAKISVIKSGEFMLLDKTARENLELIHPYREPASKRGSLLWILDETKTSMGARLLSSFISSPLQDKALINQRLDAVEVLVNDNFTAEKLRTALSKIHDISRLGGKVASRSVMPRDLLALARSVDGIGAVKEHLARINGGAASSLLKEINNDLVLLPGVVDLINQAITESPPAVIADGGYIKAGYNTKLDEYRSAGVMGREWLSKLEAKEREKCGLRELKIAYNRVTGYYFEIPMKHAANVPYRFTRRGSTANTERYTTAELKELEDKINGAEERAKDLEISLLNEIRTVMLGHLDALQQNADRLALLDVFCALAAVAVCYKWTRPNLNEKGLISLKDARHPVIERLVGANRFIANDCLLQQGSGSTMIITGPNMAGKSTYMRMVADCVILAHIGSFVPAAAADIAIIDRIFTRIGASDDMLTGQSTFMVEMNEVSNILHNATAKSLILLDEVGRGTGTNDGLALASSITTYITDKIGANTMFATHFHELTALGARNPKIKNYKATTAQIDGDIVFLHKIEPGIEESSFGIDVAKMAGLPKEVLDNARKLYNTDRVSQGKHKAMSKDLQASEMPMNSPVVSKLQGIDINRLSPMEALIVLQDLVKEAKT